MQAISKIKPPEDEGEELTDRQELEKYLQEERDYKLSGIPNNTEKYISFSLGQLRFIDSAQFLLASLAKLVAANSPEAFQITARYEPDHQKRQLLLRKGVYPYEFMDSWERFEAAQLPPKEAFYSKLSDEHISDSDYAHAQQVWKTFECRTLGDYTDLYSRTDVLLLADVFENFRKMCQKQYGLDPAHYYTSPGLSWDALLKKTRVELELLTDYDQHLFIEKGCGAASLWCRSATPGQTTRLLRATTRRSPTVTSSIWMQITSMGGQWASLFQLVAFNG